MIWTEESGRSRSVSARHKVYTFFTSFLTSETSGKGVLFTYYLKFRNQGCKSAGRAVKILGHNGPAQLKSWSGPVMLNFIYLCAEQLSTSSSIFLFSLLGFWSSFFIFELQIMLDWSAMKKSKRPKSSSNKSSKRGRKPANFKIRRRNLWN